jgi:hypothetical protein
LRYPQKEGFADRAKEIILKADSNSETNDKDYVFFILFSITCQVV